jgi:hypothetical protein
MRFDERDLMEAWRKRRVRIRRGRDCGGEGWERAWRREVRRV